VVATPVYKASYSGALKTFIDLLPQLGFAGKVVLPLATGGTPAHVLMIDYALRPVLMSLGAAHVVSGLFLLDKLLQRIDGGGLSIELQLECRLNAVVDELASAVRRAHPSS
jgi:FMN reductase